MNQCGFSAQFLLGFTMIEKSSLNLADANITFL